MELFGRTIHELQDLLKQGGITARAITESVLGRITDVDGKVKAYLSVAADEALAQADRADRERAGRKDATAVHGIPIAIKDNMCTDGVRTTCASKILANFIPPYDATVVSRLKQAGAVMPGKANMDEFAMGSSTENSGFFITRNPWDLECIAALGSDTGGSIRQPAACCGVVGLKPTYGRVSRYGLVAFASSLDQIGPITKDVTDTAIVLNVIAGHDSRDSTSANLPVPDYTASLVKDMKGMTVGIPKEYFIEGMDPEVDRAVREAVRTLEGLGAKVVEVTLPHTGYAVATYYILATSEASSNLARYDGVKYGFRAEGAKDLLDMYMRSRSQGFGPEVKRRIMLGTYALSAGYYDAYYKKGQQVRTLIKRDFDEAFRIADVIVTPTAPTAAFRIGEKSSDPLQMYLSDIFTISVNLAGIPGISIPCGFTTQGLPIGMQVLGRHFDEPSVLRTAFAYEQATVWHKKRANV
jgi:aspartyl-tRNA(Asn)/glutamyl-tRNA(Gln) amidotransferase subunit A